MPRCADHGAIHRERLVLVCATGFPAGIAEISAGAAKGRAAGISASLSSTGHVSI